MLTQRIVPKSIDPKEGEPAKYVGHVTLRCRTFEERMDLSDRFAAEESEANKQDPAGAERRKEAKATRWLRFLARQVPDYVGEVDFLRLEDGARLTSWAEVTCESDLQNVVLEVASALVVRSSVGNPSKPSCSEP